MCSTSFLCKGLAFAFRQGFITFSFFSPLRSTGTTEFYIMEMVKQGKEYHEEASQALAVTRTMLELTDANL
ncbi:uncharacterized protein G2W53_033350 [Senna tora]|uniref:Uncharacterized protein n=1 Tax=Senna tora TaxID=362788 RepID=A0A834WCR2_9FABA|nr:uncharacterized protein G2W53_033350 [Senna tora]